MHNSDIYIHLAKTGISNFQNWTFLVKVMPCFVRLEKSLYKITSLAVDLNISTVA